MGDTPLALLVKRQKEADREARRAAIWANSNSVAHYVFGFIGVAGGAVAAATASGSPGWIPVLAGTCAAIGSGLTTLFRFEARSKGHEQDRLLLRPVAEYAENEIARVRDADARMAAEALAAVQTRLDEARRSMQ